MPQRFAALVFFVCAFLLTSGGRLGSLDAGSQLQATLLGITTGNLGTPTPPPPEPLLWVQSPGGLFYQCHDFGNLVLMTPGAIVAKAVSHSSPEDLVKEPPAIARVAVSLTYAVVAGLGSYFLFLAFSLLFETMAAFWLTAVFSFATFYWAYSKTAWDVMGASAGICLLLYTSLKIRLRDSSDPKDFAALGFAFIWASAFRFSLFPSLALGGLWFLWCLRKKLNAKVVIPFFAVTTAGLVPTLIYNHVRMGSAFRPATTAAQFASTSDLQGSFLSGLYGLLLSPNKGLLWFAPVFVLLFALPLFWKNQPKERKQMGIAFALVTIPYLLLISKIRNWGTFGWGPRYLVPILPLLFYFLAPVLVGLWTKYRKPVAALVGLSFLLNLAPVLVNWSLAIADPVTSNPHLFTPKAHMRIWGALLDGLQGIPLAAPQEVLSDPVRSAGARFPDLWTVRLMELSAAGTLAGLAAIAILLAALVWSGSVFKRARP